MLVRRITELVFLCENIYSELCLNSTLPFPGWVFGLTSENVSKRDNSASFSMDAVTAEKISSLK